MQCTGVFACRNISRHDHVTSDHSLLAFIVLTFICLPDLLDSRFFLAYFLSLAFSLFRARFHDIRQQWFQTSMGDCIPFSSGDFKRAWPWHRRWTGISSPLAAERELKRDLIIGGCVKASPSYVLLISRCTGLFARLFNPVGKRSGLRDAATPHFGTGCGYNGSSGFISVQV